jgi:sugar lactone lactonase YvrE
VGELRTTTIADGIYFGEGPRWHDGRLWFSDFFAFAVKSAGMSGDVRVEVQLDDVRPSGLGWLPDGRLLMVAMQPRQVWRRELDGTIAVHADLNEIATFHCNDMVVDAHGRAYVGNFGFDLDAMLEGRAEMCGAHVARVDPDGTVTTATSPLGFPNGSVITPDGSTIVIAESMARQLSAFDIDASTGELTNHRVWASFADADPPVIPDGICLNADGHIWVANPAGTSLPLVAEGGRIVATVETTQPSFACMLGGDDRTTLFVLTAGTSVAAEAAKHPTGRLETVRVDAAGAGLP